MSNQPSSTEREILQKVLRRYYSNREKLELQIASYGGRLNAPIHLLNQYDDTENRIAEIKDWLKGFSDEPPLMVRYFRCGFQAYVKANPDYWEAKRYFEMTLDEYQHYPRAAELLAEVNQKISAKQEIIFRDVEEREIEILKPKRNWKKIFATSIVLLAAIAIIIIFLFWLLG